MTLHMVIIIPFIVFNIVDYHIDDCRLFGRDETNSLMKSQRIRRNS